MSTPPPGYLAALQTVTLGRVAFFGTHDEDLPEAESEQIAADDRLPQFGYVGPNYSTRRILFLGINPGNGPRSSRNPGDQIQMPFLDRFVKDPKPETFRLAQQAHRKACEGWFIWGRECSELLDFAGLKSDDIAFSNALPWRTRSQAAFSRRVEQLAAHHYVRPLLADLQPRVVVALGKKVQRMLADTQLPVDATVVWNRARALTPSVRQERDAARDLLKRLVQQ